MRSVDLRNYITSSQSSTSNLTLGGTLRIGSARVRQTDSTALIYQLGWVGDRSVPIISVEGNSSPCQILNEKQKFEMMNIPSQLPKFLYLSQYLGFFEGIFQLVPGTVCYPGLFVPFRVYSHKFLEAIERHRIVSQ